MDMDKVNTPEMLSDEPTSSDQSRVKSCSMCPATFTRKTHLNRHIRSHMNERTYRCDACESQFTRSDLLTRHKKTCGETRSRRKSCEACAKAKVKCNLQHPCEKCTARGIDCEFTNDPSVSRAKVRAAARAHKSRAGTISCRASTSPRTPTPEPSIAFTTLPTPDTVDLTSDLTPLSPPTSCDPLAAFSPLGGGNSTIGHFDNYLGSSPRMSFDDLTTDFMQLLERPEDMISTGAFDFESIVGTTASIPAGTSAADNMQMSDTDFANSSAFLPATINPTDDFSYFDFSSATCSESSMTSSSLLSSAPMSESAPTSPPVSQAELAFIEPLSGTNQAKIVTDAELRVYTHLFFSAFIAQLPVVHEATWREDDKPPVLIRVMQACGALFVRTAQAAQFVMHTLATAREEIVQEYACQTSDPLAQFHLILAFALLQALGMFHQRADQRRVSTVYHGVLKMMIARSGLLETVQAWTPPEFYEDKPVEEAWLAWSQYETAKRLCCLAHLQDCAQVIFFAMPSSSKLEFDGYLPCDDALWNARTAQDWANGLRTSSHYGSSSARLRGANAQSTLTALVERTPPAVTSHLPTFAHYLLIHTILSYIYSHMPTGMPILAASSSSSSSPDAGGALPETHGAQHAHAAFTMQHALQNWLLNWQDEASKSSFIGAPPFTSDALPYYRLAQVSLLMLCEDDGGAHGRHGAPAHTNAKVEVRFRVLKDWVRQMRGPSRTVQLAPADLRENLMKLRMLYASAEVMNVGMEMDHGDGLLAFFPEH